MTFILQNPFDQPNSLNGEVYPGAKLHVYKAGTTTDADVWQDKDKVATHANPVIADSNGRFPQIWIEEAVALRLVDASDVLIDNSHDYVGKTEADTAASLEAANSALFAQDTATTSGLTFGYQTGRVDKGNGTVVSVSAGTISLTDNILNYVYLDYSDDTVKASTSNPGSNTATLFEVTTSSGAITLVTPQSTHFKTPTTRSFPPGHLQGLGITNESDEGDTDHDFKLAVGSARGANDSLDISLTSALYKEIDNSWAEGDGLGGKPTAVTLTANTRYNVFVIVKSDGTVDGGIDTSDTAANLLSDASEYTDYAHVGYIRVDGSNNINYVWNVEPEHSDGILIDAFDATTVSAVEFFTDWSSYRRIEIECTELSPSADDRQLMTQFTTDGGSTYETGAADYNFTEHYIGQVANHTDSSDASVENNGINVFRGTNAMSNAAGEAANVTFEINQHNSGSLPTMARYRGDRLDASSQFVGLYGMGHLVATTAVDGARFQAGNVGTVDGTLSGKFRVRAWR